MEKTPTEIVHDLTISEFSDLDTMRWNAFIEADVPTLNSVAHEANLRLVRIHTHTEEFRRYSMLRDGCLADIEKIERIHNG